jgi:hypothetical protein
VHAEAFEFVATSVAQLGPWQVVLEIGGRNVNGTVRDLFGDCSYTTLDIAPGDGVDIVADAATWAPDRVYDCVVTCEVFEHTASWPQILATAARALRPGGTLIVTAASWPRAAHSAIDGGMLRPGEYYCNVDSGELADALATAGFHGQVTRHEHGDVYAAAHRARVLEVAR